MTEFGRTGTTRISGERLRVLARGLLLAACGAVFCAGASTQTLQLVPQTFPVTQLGQTTTLGLTLNITSDVAYISPTVTVDGGEYAYTGVTGCAGGSYMAAGTVCTLNVNFTPQLPGQASSPVPIARTGVLTIKYFDIVAGQTGNGIRYQSFLLSGSGTGPHAVLSPGVVSDVVGSDVTPQVGFAGDGGPASAAVFHSPGAIAMDLAGNIYIADTGNNVVRVVYAGGTVPNVTNPVVGNIYTIAGVAPTGGASTAGPGPDGNLATQSALNQPSGLALDSFGNLYIADTGNNAVREVSASTGVITTVAGQLYVDCTVSNCYGGDGGLAVQANLWGPAGVAVNGNGNLYIADTVNHVVREVSATTGNISTIAGNPAPSPTGNDGDGGPATQANLNAPVAVTVDSAGDVYISDSLDDAVRRVDAVTGNISTVAQTTSAPGGLSVDSADNVYFTLPAACTVSEWNPYYLATIPFAGNGSCTASGDGSVATSAGFNGAAGLVVNGNGNVYVLESDGVRLVDGSRSAYAFGSLHLGDVSATLSTSISNNDIVYLANRYVSPWQLNFLSGNFYSNNYTLPTPFLLQPYTNASVNEIDCNSASSATFSLYPGESCGLAMNVQPTADGTLGGNFTFYTTSYTPTSGGNTNNTPENLPVAATVTGAQPTATLTGGPLTFTAVVNEGSSAAQALTLTNTGSSTLTISQIYTSNISFQETDTCGISVGAGGMVTGSPILAAGASCQINVTFHAYNAGAQNGTLYVVDDASSGGGTQTALLSGTTTYPVATLQPLQLNFASTPMTGSATQTAQLTNTGSAPLNIASFTLTGNDPGAFSVVSNNCGTSLAAGAACTIRLRFVPYAYAYYSADLNVLDDSGGAQSVSYYVTQNVHLVGTTGTTYPSVNVTAGNTAFPATAVGATSTQTVTLTLGGAAILTQISIAPGFPEFTVGAVTGCSIGAQVAAGTTCSVQVSFTPIGVGNRTAPLTLTLAAANGANPYAIGLTGSSTGPLAALTPGIMTDWAGLADVSAGTGIIGADGPAPQAVMGSVPGMAMDASGTIYVSDGTDDVIWRIDPGDYAHLYAGTPFVYGGYIEDSSGDGGTALGSRLGGGPGPLALDARGGLYVAQGADNYGNPSRIRYIDPATNLITTAVGFVTAGSWAATTSFLYQTRIVVNVSGTSHAYMALAAGTSGATAPAWPTGLGQTVPDSGVVWINQGVYFGGAGCAAQTDSYGDGCTALQTTVGGDLGMVVDAQGNLYFSDTGSSVGSTNTPGSSHSLIRRVDAGTHLVTAVAGTGVPGFSGDGGAATQAQVYATDLALDAQGNLNFIDGGLRVRQVNLTTGVITTIAGNGATLTAYTNLCTAETGDGGPALSASFAGLGGLAFDAANNLYLSDNAACNIRRVDAATQTVNLIAGQNGNYYHQASGNLGQFGADGSALEASLYRPKFVRVDGWGNVFIADGGGGVRKIDVSKSVLPFGVPYPGAAGWPIDALSGPLSARFVNAGNSGSVAFSTPFSASPWGISDPSYIRDVNSPTGVADCYNQGAIAVGTECPISVDFGPLVDGPIAATLTVNDNGINAPQTISLTGMASGTPPGVTLLPFLLSFTASQGTSSTPQLLSLTNNNASPLPIGSITIAGTNAAQFSQTNDCGSMLAASSNCTIQVVFSPPVVAANPTLGQGNGIVTAQVVVTDTAGNSPQTSSLTGTALAPLAPSLTINEMIHVSDGTPTLVPSTPLLVNETIHVGDGTPSLVQSTSLAIQEVIHVGDGLPSPVESTSLSISETIHVSDISTPGAGGSGLTIPTIVFTVANHTFSDLPFGVSATSNSSGALSYSLVSGAANLSVINGGAFVTLTGAGTVTLLVSQAATGSFSAGSQQVSFLVAPETPGISWVPASGVVLSGKAIGAGVVDATSSVAGTISYTATLSGGAAVPVTATTVLAAGSYTMTATLTPTDATDYNTATATAPLQVVVQHIWVVNGNGTLSALDAGGAVVSNASGPGAAVGVAVDAAGDLWTLGSGGNSLGDYDPTGAALHVGLSGGGLGGATALAIDGNGSIWTANAGNSVSEFNSAGAATSPAGGFTGGGLSAPAGVAIDSAGNVWITNSGNDSVTELLGAAAPVAPIASAVQNHTLGVKP